MTRREGVLAALALIAGSPCPAKPKRKREDGAAAYRMDENVPNALAPPDTMAVRFADSTTSIQIQAQGRAVTISVREILDALGAK